MKIVYFGTDVFLSCFTYFVGYHEVLALYTYHNDEDYFTEYSIVKEASKRNIPVHYEDMSKEETIRLFEEEGCRLFFSAEYNRMIPVPQELEVFRGINIHSSLLPDGRSYYPIEAAMERGLQRSGVTMHKMTSMIDSGDILGQIPVEIEKNMDSIDVYMQCAIAAEQMLKMFMENFDACWNRAFKQDEPGKHPYWKRPSDEKITLTHRMTMEEAKACFRCYNQLTQVEMKGKWYYVRMMDVGVTRIAEKIIQIDDDRVVYQVADGHLRLILQERDGAADEK